MTAWLQGAHAALTEFVALGGWVVALLLCVSVVAGAAVLWKLWHLASLRAGATRDLDRARGLWAGGARSEARRLLAGTGGPMDLLALRGMEAIARGTDGTALRGRLQAEADAVQAQMEKGLRFLDAVAQTAPLLGLFGTVLGMIEAFQTLQGGGSAGVDAAQLAGGIWVALLTTAMGLGVAMPVSLMLGWFEARISAASQAAHLTIETLCGADLPWPGAGQSPAAPAFDLRPARA